MTGLKAQRRDVDDLHLDMHGQDNGTTSYEAEDGYAASPDPVTAQPKRRPTAWIVSGLIIIAALGYFSYGRLQTAPAPAPPSGAVPVEVQTMAKTSVRLWSDFSAHTRAVDQADIRPEVSGRIVEIRFKDGQTVKAGDVLLVIDPRPYEAALAKAKAALVSAGSNAEFTKTELDRAQTMLKTQAIARRLYDQRQTDSRNATAAVQSAQADVTDAALDVERAYVRAPISGRTGRTELTVGNLVQAGSGAPLLTSIVSTNGIYADFEVDEQTYMQTIHDGAGNKDQESRIPVQLIAGDSPDAAGAAKTYDGSIYTFDNHIDPASGTIRARAKFANEDGALVPGMFVSVRLGDAKPATAIMMPEKAVNTDQDKKFVYVVGSDNKVQYRPVKLGTALNDARVVLAGVQAGDRVIVNGLQHVRPDAVVTAKEAPAETLQPPPAGGDAAQVSKAAETTESGK